MICLHCGKELNGNEQICPDCGNVVDESSVYNENIEKPVLLSVSNVDDIGTEEQLSITQPIVSKNFVVDTQVVNENTQVLFKKDVANEEENEENDENKGHKKILIIIYIVLIIALFIAGVFLISKYKKAKANRNNSNNSVVASSVNNTNNVDFLGYSFNVPDGFKSSIEDGKVFFESGSVVYFISFDFSNSFEDYEKEFIKSFPKQAGLIKKKYYDREFLAVVLVDDASSTEVCEYVTKGNGKDVIVGEFINSENKINDDDFLVLTKIIDSSMSVASSFSTINTSENNIGKYGIKIFDISEIKNNKFRSFYKSNVE